MIPQIEIKSKAEIQQVQELKLQETLSYALENSSFYSKLFIDNKLSIKDIKTLKDLEKIPVTTKRELQEHESEFLCVEPHDIVDYVTTSGTTGDPVFFGLTDKDLDRLAYNEAISLACSGVSKQDVIQLTTTIDRRFMAGLAYFLGVRQLGAGIIRVGAGIPELQWDSILKFNPTYLIAVPSFILKLIEYAEHNHIDYRKSSVKGVICIGESLKNEDLTPNVLATKITSKWDLKLFSTYASTEMSTAFAECEMRCGGHEHPELIITEILDENDQPVAKGEAGELVITTLGVEAMPLIRFKTGDIVRKMTEPCSCGRNTARLGPIIGRKQQMIKYKGTTLYPPAMFNLLHDFSEIDNYIIEIDKNDIGTDTITIAVGTDVESKELKAKLKDHFRAKLRVSPEIEFRSKADINQQRFPKMSRKPILYIDKR